LVLGQFGDAQTAKGSWMKPWPSRRTGGVSLLTDGPVARPGHLEDPTLLNQQEVTDLIQQTVDMRRGADLLLARPDVDAKRLVLCRA
jgi:hypothetical protein